jgi:hypothetical protein
MHACVCLCCCRMVGPLVVMQTSTMILWMQHQQRPAAGLAPLAPRSSRQHPCWPLQQQPSGQHRQQLPSHHSHGQQPGLLLLVVAALQEEGPPGRRCLLVVAWPGSAAGQRQATATRQRSGARRCCRRRTTAAAAGPASQGLQLAGLQRACQGLQGWKAQVCGCLQH